MNNCDLILRHRIHFHRLGHFTGSINSNVEYLDFKISNTRNEKAISGNDIIVIF